MRTEPDDDDAGLRLTLRATAAIGGSRATRAAAEVMATKGAAIGATTEGAARRQIGYVRLSAGSPMTVGDCVALIDRVGPMGGSVDVAIAIAIGGGRHRMRLHRVGVAGPEFTMAAWGSLKFPGGGDGSVLEAGDALGAPAPVPADRGLPLVRQGLDGAPTSAPYRFADPEDLLDPSSPARDYEWVANRVNPVDKCVLFAL